MQKVNENLYRSCRPGYPSETVGKAVVDEFLAEIAHRGIRTVVCLLDERQLAYYGAHPAGGLLNAYRAAGLTVIHRPVADYQAPPVPEEVLEQIRQDFAQAEKPVLVHCSAGCDRTGAVVRDLTGQCP